MSFIPLLAMGLLACVLTEPSDAGPRVVESRDGLPNVFDKLRARRPVTVVYLGGSITSGAGSSDGNKTSYRALVGRWLTTSFPKATVKNVNAAVGGTGSGLGAFRLARDVVAHKPDLVFVEFAVNDNETPDVMIDRAMEGIVRQIRAADGSTDVCFVYTFIVPQLAEYRAGGLPHAVKRHEAVASYYGIPSVNVGLVAARQLIGARLTPDEFAKDQVHPADAGYRIYADSLIEFLKTQRDASLRPVRRPLPTPLRPDALEHTRMIGPKEVTPLGAGWSVDAANPTGHFPGGLLIASSPGAQQTVRFTGRTLGLFFILAPDTGSFEYQIDDGGWKLVDPYSVFGKASFLPSFRLLEDGLPDAEHTLRIKVRREHHPDSKGTTTRLGYLLVSSGRRFVPATR